MVRKFFGLFFKKKALLSGFFFLGVMSWVSHAEKPQPAAQLYRWVGAPTQAAKEVVEAELRLQQALENPEFLLQHWIALPTAPNSTSSKVQRLSLREAILLALRYNPNIQNAELDRIIQRYQLRLARNQFEVQYALAGTAVYDKSHYEGIGSASNNTYLATPEISLQNKYGGKIDLNLANNVSSVYAYNPILNLNITQPLLRGFGRTVNEVALNNAVDNEWLNKINLKQSVIDQITQVISAYRSLILSGNNVASQKMQLQETKKTFDINEKKIAAGQLETTANIQQSYQLESLNLTVEQAENDFNTSTQNLLQAIGLDPTMRLSIPSDVQVGAIAIPNLNKTIQIALKNNSQYLAQTIAIRADERAYQTAKNQQLWQLDVGANAALGTANTVDNQGGVANIYNGRNISESVNITLTIPIRDIGRRSELISAKIQLEKDRLNRVAMRRSLITAITNTINSIRSQAKQYQLAQKQVKLANQSYNLEKKKLEAGISTSLDVNNTQNQLIQAQRGLISAKISYLNQLSSLQQFIGSTLDEWNIQLRYGQ